jgi:hypothetical protein
MVQVSQTIQAPRAIDFCLLAKLTINDMGLRRTAFGEPNENHAVWSTSPESEQCQRPGSGRQ